LAEHGIAGRAVLVDVDRYVRARGGRIDHGQGEAIPVATDAAGGAGSPANAVAIR
jgi:hypothetical protein